MHNQQHSVPGSIMITVDFEDWFQVENLRHSFPHEKWESCELRIERNAYKLLELFDLFGIQATFFVLGWVAKRRKGLIAKIADMGHEIASHGYYHRICHDLSVSELRKDLEMSREVLADIIGRAPLGYRAPNFSITEELVGLLQELNFVYDSSYNNFTLNKRHGRADGLKVTPQGCLAFANGVKELPVSNLDVAGKTIPWAGGGYFRFWPIHLFELGVSRILQSQGHYVFYCHPWEVDPAQPRQARGIGTLNRFRHYLNLDKTLKKLRHFFASFHENNFMSCSQFLKVDRYESMGIEKTSAQYVPVQPKIRVNAV
ncbi:MAG: polysaccharide deacetylase [Deltaproteobacteria bacterium]|nr:polysaccharide deacetylase [Deltaproteobacteria bacterium]